MKRRELPEAEIIDDAEDLLDDYLALIEELRELERDLAVVKGKLRRILDATV